MTALSSRDIASTQAGSPRPKLDHPMGIKTILIFLADHGPWALLRSLEYL